MPESNDNFAPLVRHLIHDPCLPRRGNDFDIRRPAPPLAAKASAHSHPAAPARPTVLVVGEAAGECASLAGILVGAGLETIRTGSDPRTLAQVPTSRADLVLLEVPMPSAAGFEMFRRLRAGDGAPGVPILFVSAVEDEGARLAGFAAGADDHLSRPFVSSEVLARVSVHLELQQLRRAQENRGRLHRGAEVQLEAAVAQPVLVVDPAGQIVFCTQRARDLLRRHLPTFNPAAPLPPGVLREEPFPAVPGRPGLHARRVTGDLPAVGEHGLTVLLLEEEPPHPSEILLKALKLTRTEANVLYWVREGKTSPEIAIILGAALPTVKKHLEHVYEKLGVETRTAAALIASEVLGRRGAL